MNCEILHMCLEKRIDKLYDIFSKTNKVQGKILEPITQNLLVNFSDGNHNRKILNFSLSSTERSEFISLKGVQYLFFFILIT